VKSQGAGNILLDEAKWGTPAANQVIEQHWDWKLSDAQWAEAVKQEGEGKKEDVKFDLWIPEGVKSARGIVVISGHGSGEALYEHAELRKIARELHLALFKIWPSSKRCGKSMTRYGTTPSSRRQATPPAIKPGRSSSPSSVTASPRACLRMQMQPKDR
jgi:hypothetical protein